MGRDYTQLTLEDRCEMARLHTTGHSIRQIAATLDRAPSTVARELNRNGSTTQGYQPGYADQQARARRWQGSKLDRDSTLRATVLAQLQHGWSPQQVAGRLAREQHRPVISHETIYRFIYAQMARKTEYSWRHYLPRAKAKRGRRCYKGRSPASFIALRRPLAERPAAVADRRTPGHWEADLMLFRIYGQAILTLHERHSRLLILPRAPPGKAAAPIALAIATLLWRPCPPRGAKRSPSITGRSLRGMTPSMLSASRPSSVRPTRPGKRAASRTPSAACAGPCRARPTWRPSRRSTLHASSRHIIILRENASAIRPQPRFLGTTCCTSNVNPPPHKQKHESALSIKAIRVSVLVIRERKFFHFNNTLTTC